MSIKRIIFVFIIVMVAFAVCIGFWLLHTDVVLSPDSVDIPTESNDAADPVDAIVENGDQNVTDASSYVETIPDVSESAADGKDAKDILLR